MRARCRRAPVSQQWFCSPVSCLQLAGPPAQELDPRPLPGGNRKGRAEAASIAESGGQPESAGKGRKPGCGIGGPQSGAGRSYKAEKSKGSGWEPLLPTCLVPPSLPRGSWKHH